jgi:FkbM family methyltransferase|tara:strand:+ start:3307 stop:4047 length:741 start_codon:yes stop_codon:yes gene_type:complete
MFNLINNIYLKIFKILNILISYNAKVYYSFFKYGTSPSFEHIKIFKNIDDKSTFVDVGANRGQFSLLIHYLYPKNKIIAYEPLKSEFSILKNIFKNTKNIKLFNLAVGSEKKSVNIYQTEKEDSSSLLKPGKLQLKYFPKTYVKKILKTKMIKLNTHIKNLKKPAFLKIDVQGYELEVLKGADLKRFKYIYLEGSYVKLYSNQPLIKSISNYLLLKGFEKIGRFNLMKNIFGKPLQADFLFINIRK